MKSKLNQLEERMKEERQRIEQEIKDTMVSKMKELKNKGDSIDCCYYEGDQIKFFTYTLQFSLGDIVILNSGVFDIQQGAIGKVIGWNAEHDGAFFCEVEFSNGKIEKCIFEEELLPFDNFAQEFVCEIVDLDKYFKAKKENKEA